MLDASKRHSNPAPWWGLFFAIAAAGCNAAFFANPPLSATLPWLSLILVVVAFIFLIVGLKRAFGLPQIYRGKILSVVLFVVALLPAAMSAFIFVDARKLPSAEAAPQVGQRVPDFTLADTFGKPVSLDDLLAATASASVTASQARAPKAVLLIFYRGYW